MKRTATLIILLVPLLLIFLVGYAAGLISDGAGWLNDRCKDLFVELYRGGGKS